MLNQVTIMGRLVRDPELKHTTNDIAVVSFTLAVDRDAVPGNTGVREVDFIDCVAWRKTAEMICKYFAKGRMMVLSGRLQSRVWTDKDGNNRQSLQIVADRVYFGDSKRDSSEKPAVKAPEESAPAEAPEEEDTDEKPMDYMGYKDDQLPF